MRSDQPDPTTDPSDHDPRGCPERAALEPHPKPLTLASPTDVIATLPYLVGTPPDPGIVVLALRGTRVHAVFRRALDRVDGDLTPRQIVLPPVEIAAAEECTALVLVAYGPPERVTPHVDWFLLAARERRITVVDALRVTGGRYWSYTCVNPACCPPEGTAFDVDTSTVPAHATLAGIAPVPPFHATLADVARVRAVLEPVAGEAGATMEAVTAEVEDRVRNLVEQGVALADLGLPAVRSAVRGERRGRAVTEPEELAALGVYLTEVPVRDEVWARITAESARAHQRLWGRVARHVPERLRAAPVSLLAVAAWQSDDEALASAALDTALTADPGYSMAVLMSRALAWGMPVEKWREFVPRWLEGRGEWPEE